MIEKLVYRFRGSRKQLIEKRVKKIFAGSV